MFKRFKRNLFILVATVTASTMLGAAAIDAFSASSTNYKLDDAGITSFGGSASSTNYQLTDAGGEAFIGPGSSTTYKFNAGFVAQLEHTISLTLDSLAVAVPQIQPGTSQTATSQVTVFTDAAGYLLSTYQDKDLTHTDGTTTIAAISSTIGTPALWSEGTTKGLGFSLTSGSSLDTKWGSNPSYKYAAFPGTATTVHDKPTYQNTNDVTTVQYRIDVTPTQKVGAYSNNITYSATVKP